MKVMCITNEDFTGEGMRKIGPQVGDIVTAIGECRGYGTNGCVVDCYIIEEYDDGDMCFDKRNFAPLSGIDEMELVNIKEECV